MNSGGRDERDCADFNLDVMVEIRALRKSGLRGVVLAAMWKKYTDDPSRNLQATAALRATLTELEELGLRTVLVAPMLLFPAEAQKCVVRRKLADCSISRNEAERYRADAMQWLTAIAEDFPQTRIVDPLQTLCVSDICSPLVGNKLLWRDRHHLSEQGSLALLPQFSPQLEWAMAREALLDMGHHASAVVGSHD